MPASDTTENDDARPPASEESPAQPSEAPPAEPSKEPPAQASPQRPRLSLALISLVHAAVFAWAAHTLPWQEWTAFALIAGAVAILHLGTAILALIKHQLLPKVWRVQAAASTLLLAYAGWGLFSSAWYVSHVYGGLGQGLSAALMAVFGLLVMLTVPLSLWGFFSTGGIRLGKAGNLALVLLVGLTALQLKLLTDKAAGETLVAQERIAQFESQLAAIQVKPQRLTKRTSLMRQEPAPCSAQRDQTTLVVTFLEKATAPKNSFAPTTKCLTAKTAAGVATQLKALLRSAHGPVKLDLLETRFELPEMQWLGALAFRPGQDGACSTDKCLMPWQLAAMDMFTSQKLIPSVPDARLGVSLKMLRKQLAITDEAAPLVRISTRGWLIDATGKVVSLGRARRLSAEVTPDEIQLTERLAQSHIFAAQARDGRFRYMTQPHTGNASNSGFSVPRQAGTTMVVCELADKKQRLKPRIVERGMGMLASLEQPLGSLGEGERAVLIYPKGAKPNLVGVGASALSLAAALRCRHILGERHDALIGRLARMLLAQQREDGSFRHRLDRRDGNPIESLGSLYVDGQAVLGLTLLEDIAAESEGVFPSKARLHEAVEKAMVFYGSAYWQIPLRSFLFLEENWHCIAAAASLYHHRNDAYEQFCLDYVRFKARIVLDEQSGVHDEFLGGYAFGNIVPPHNTATAGFGEALAAAIKVKRARKEPIEEDAKRMRRVVGFLLRNQWRADTCYACSPKQRVVGGFSEHMASPNIRIDYVQHAWAAIGHGSRAAGLLEVSEPGT